MTTLGIDSTLRKLARITEDLKKRQEPAPRWRRALAGAFDFVARGLWHVWRNRRYLTPLKLANMAGIQLQARLRTERVFGMPYSMKIEPTNICNTKCQLCPTGIGLSGRPKGKMRYEDYTRLIDQLKPWLYTLDLSMWGDPLIVPDIYRMIRYAHQNRIWTYLSSNLHAFKPEKGQADELVASGLDMMTCSLHGASQATYEIYQPGKDFEASIAKIRAINEAKARLGSRTPVIQLNFVVTRFNEHEKAAFQRLAEELDCRALFSSPSVNVRFMDRDKNLTPLGLSPELQRDRIRQSLQQWLPKDQEHVIEPYKKMLAGEYHEEDYNGKKVLPCRWPWRDAVINWDGSVVTCCGSWEIEDDMGNVMTQPFSRIWNSKSYRMARRSFNRKVEKIEGVANPCRTCPGFMV